MFDVSTAQYRGCKLTKGSCLYVGVVCRSRPLIRHFILLGRRKGLGALLFGSGEMSDVEPDTFTE